jgi:hypothetical protein
MLFKEWNPWYEKIVGDLDLSVEQDIQAAYILDKLLEIKRNLISLTTLQAILQHKNVLVFGAGPSLEPSIIELKHTFDNYLLITADGATSALLKHDLHPALIVTDLDGNIPDQQQTNKNGSIAVIHAHGNNIDQIKQYVPAFTGPVFGTTQTKPNPYKNLHNFGGFTDGDRAICLAEYFNATKIYLLGFDLQDEPGPYSYPEHKDTARKQKKLRWCSYLIKYLNEKHRNIYFLKH